MVVTVDFAVISAWLGGAVCIIAPLVLAIGLYANYRVVRRDEEKL